MKMDITITGIEIDAETGYLAKVQGFADPKEAIRAFEARERQTVKVSINRKHYYDVCVITHVDMGGNVVLRPERFFRHNGLKIGEVS